MLNYAGTPPLAAMAETDSRQLIAAELRSLIARIEISMRLIDAAMEPDDDSAVLTADLGSSDIIVLDDITPRFATASAALNACRAELGHALKKLSESGNPA
ncbi:hypothetical protein L6654_38720 [Bradyrhizobium sp. WYCCWR 13023]|uniref:Uncharacterized protein n=1 Tax=Bradyrhizobium zhengyangense TaxID=2911009 RepID=A0A9X1RJY9_9BRAD|nr:MULTISPECIES: hypothetical protein [Bradyrhizobium]MCG2632543.1 hypothetical protein [Bradyrhizobium zhengyangense]MCG2642524.1 hypothetical protein [Bradyrhizobium zhengyangense]MCG2667587.1 hypothetical protein [Bradyrhizobium zhengyangense]MDA9522315.1 hypothetical protein [Bradyrhizobium sp. CCBAU 11434]